MPRIFDNIEARLMDELKSTLAEAVRADFCVGYFNLRGWKHLRPHINHLQGGENAQVRLLIGMHRSPRDEVAAQYRLSQSGDAIDTPKAKRLSRQMVEEFRQQLMTGAPNNEDEQALRDLAHDLRSGRLVVKLFLRYPLHAKLYIGHRSDRIATAVSYLGSSNLTFSGLAGQGELNIDVVDNDACIKLIQWFKDRWEDRFCLDITQELLTVLDESWARDELIPPYHIYLKMAYHLSQEARDGMGGRWRLPKDFDDLLFDYQKAAVQVAAHHLNKRGGVLLGDVVGLGKTLMAAAVAKIFQEDQDTSVLILCPKNLESMWNRVKDEYRLAGRVIPISMAEKVLGELTRFRLVIIDESHNLRNREGARYASIRDYIARMESKVILLSATPYNKTFSDLGNQFRLFLSPDADLGVRPEALLRELGGEAFFTSRHNAPVRSLSAFEQSPYADDWRDLMRLFMVRRTRSFIIDIYAERDALTGRPYLEMRDGTRSYFPVRQPKTVAFEQDAQYSRLYSDQVVNAVNQLALPRYGLGQYVNNKARQEASKAEQEQLDNLSRAGKRLMGFCRTNLFKRLESSGASFVQSIDRHLMRNLIYLYAIDNGLPLPLGTLDAGSLDPDFVDEDSDSVQSLMFDLEGEPDDINSLLDPVQQRAKDLYDQFRTAYAKRFKWARSELFLPALRHDLESDSDLLRAILTYAGSWDAQNDAKLNALIELATQTHPDEKLLVFSQFADTVRYLYDGMRAVGITQIEKATGGSADVTRTAHRFSPVSNRVNIAEQDEVRVLLTTDVLSEGQNLQDAGIVVNFDLPWAIIRLSQRAGRVDRIGQQAEIIRCYSFLPQDGVEQLINLRARVSQRLRDNGEVIGSDERFFEDQAAATALHDLYTERSSILDGRDSDDDTDLSSYAKGIWDKATQHNPNLKDSIEKMPDVVYSAREYIGSVERPQGVLVYIKTRDGYDALEWVSRDGQSVTQSQRAILYAAECRPDTPAIERQADHHDRVREAIERIQESFQPGTAGALGGPTSVRRKVYERLETYIKGMKSKMPLWMTPEVSKRLQDIQQHVFTYPLTETARNGLGRQLRAGINDEDFVTVLENYYDDSTLVVIPKEGDDIDAEPHIVCSLGLHGL